MSKRSARSVDYKANRNSSKWTLKEQAGRVAWALLMPVFRLSPRPLWGWRRAILRLFGAQVGKDVHVYPTVRISMPWNLTLQTGCAVGDRVILYSLGPIDIGERATISQGAHLCAGSHDIMDPARRLLKPPILIGKDAWICADAFIGPGVEIGEGAIVGARGVTMKNVPANTVVAGNPARQIRTL